MVFDDILERENNFVDNKNSKIFNFQFFFNWQFFHLINSAKNMTEKYV